MFSACVVIPVYNHERTVAAVVQEVLGQGLPCILVDDGSAPACASELDRLAADNSERIVLVRNPVNLGKGGAVLAGIRRAALGGFSHAVQIDADGQHHAGDIPRFVRQAEARPDALVVGCPEYDDSAPTLRLWARSLTHVWVSINTLSRQIKDSMCGFRVYPIAPVLALDARHRLGARMNFDIEIVVRLYWAGIEIINLPTPVAYPKDGVSHYRGWLDSLLISRLHAVLFFGMLQRLPLLIARKLER